MVKTDMNREGKFFPDKIILTSKADQEMTHMEFLQVYSEKVMETQGLENQLIQLKSKLRDLSNIEETEELKKLKEMLVIAEKLKERDETRDKTKKGELKLIGLREEMKDMHALAQKVKAHLQEAKKND